MADHGGSLREAFGERGGNEVDTQGDAFFFSFPRARDAVGAAVAAQRALAGHDWPRGAEVRVRMGLHTGEPTVGEEGYIGLDVVRAARICSAGHGGQILVSETTRALLGNELPSGVSVRDLGEQQLKDIQHEHVYELALEESAQKFPPLKQAESDGRRRPLAHGSRTRSTATSNSSWTRRSAARGTRAAGAPPSVRFRWRRSRKT